VHRCPSSPYFSLQPSAFSLQPSAFSLRSSFGGPAVALAKAGSIASVSLDTILRVPSFTHQDLQRLARLARLELTAAETELFTRQLGDILEFVRQIQAVDTSAVAVDEPPGDAASPGFRTDSVRPSLDRDAVLAEAPQADAAAGLFKVPRVLNG
jgi:aspartyl-tRNA(Asn)/glutamyl-tRNA(Gln) amidotransferase subunit C